MLRSRHSRYLFIFAFVLMPGIVSAQIDTGVWLAPMVGEIYRFFSVLIPLFMAIALAAFVFGAVRYFIWRAEDAETRAAARQFMLYGLIGLVLIVAVWGIVNLLLLMLGLSSATGAPAIPCLPGGPCV